MDFTLRGGMMQTEQQEPKQENQCARIVGMVNFDLAAIGVDGSKGFSYYFNEDQKNMIIMNLSLMGII